MGTALHVLRTLTLSLWVGGIAFFAFALAPVAFHVLPNTHEAGLVVSGSLRILHTVGVACGIIFLAATFASLANRSTAQRRPLPTVLVFLMVCLTAYSALSILPRMERDRAAAGGDISSVPITAPARVDFDRLHHRSEQVEGSILLAGLVALSLVAADPRRSHVGFSATR